MELLGRAKILDRLHEKQVMSPHLRKYWETFRSSFWFIPTLMATAAAVMSFVVVSLDRSLPESWDSQGWGYGGGPEGARAVLSVIASSMITVAGVVFSITIVVLTLASSQFGPRLLRNFMRDTANQVVLGTFIATYLYCLLVLRTIRGLDDKDFVPHIAVALGVLLGIASLGVLIYFIHHVSISIQATHIIGTVGEELRLTIERLFPSELGHGKEGLEHHPPENTTPSDCPPLTTEVHATRTGYVQAIDTDGLMAVARDSHLVVIVCQRPGMFVIKGEKIADLCARSRADEAIAQQVADMFIVGQERNATQDLEFIVGQLVEVALRALSPGINDPFTAISCIDWLSAGLCDLAGRELPNSRRYDSDGSLRVIADSVTFDSIADLAFNQIRLASRSYPAINARLLNAVRPIAARAKRDSDIQCLRSHAELVWQNACSETLQGPDRSTLEYAYQQTISVLNKGWADGSRS